MIQKKIRDVFSQFLEAVIEDLKMTGRDMNFKIECKYLAETINPNYKYFYGVVKDCEDFYFQFWDEEDVYITSAREIATLKPELLSVEIENDFVKIYTNCINGHAGGSIFIKAADIKIYDEDFRQVDLEEIMEMSEKYWFSHNKAEG